MTYASGYLQVCPAGRFGVCAECGWLGPDRPDEASAQLDLDNHLRLHNTLLAAKKAMMVTAARDAEVARYLNGDHWEP